MNTPDIRVGDIVRVGEGKKTWTVEEFFDGWPDTTLARLIPTDGYTATSAEVGRLTLVERPGATT